MMLTAGRIYVKKRELAVIWLYIIKIF